MPAGAAKSHACDLRGRDFIVQFDSTAADRSAPEPRGESSKPLPSAAERLGDAGPPSNCRTGGRLARCEPPRREIPLRQQVHAICRHNEGRRRCARRRANRRQQISCLACSDCDDACEVGQRASLAASQLWAACDQEPLIGTDQVCALIDGQASSCHTGAVRRGPPRGRRRGARAAAPTVQRWRRSGLRARCGTLTSILQAEDF